MRIFEILLVSNKDNMVLGCQDRPFPSYVWCSVDQQASCVDRLHYSLLFFFLVSGPIYTPIERCQPAWLWLCHRSGLHAWISRTVQQMRRIVHVAKISRHQLVLQDRLLDNVQQARARPAGLLASQLASHHQRALVIRSLAIGQYLINNNKNMYSTQ